MAGLLETRKVQTDHDFLFQPDIGVFITWAFILYGLGYGARAPNTNSVCPLLLLLFLFIYFLFFYRKSVNFIERKLTIVG